MNSTPSLSDPPPNTRRDFLDLQPPTGDASELAARPTHSENGELPLTTPQTSTLGDADLVRHSMGLYQLLGEVARGGMGIVFKARHTVLNRIVALKIMRADAGFWPQDRQRFEREMRASAHLSHTNILPIYDIGWQDGKPYYTMPYVTGGSLASHRRRFLDDPRQALSLMVRVARAVHHAHERGIVHRDLKPANILLDENDTPFVSDFGLARMGNDNVELTETGAVVGTPSYMAPEQAAGKSREIGPATDIWALGVILYELLTGQRPFRGESVEDVKQRIRTVQPQRPRTVRPELDSELEGIVLKCLEKSPERRYVTAAQLADELDRYLNIPDHLLSTKIQIHPRGRPAARSVLSGAILLLFLLASALILLPASLVDPQRSPSAVKISPPRPLVLVAENSTPPLFRRLSGGPLARVLTLPPRAPLSIRAGDELALLELCKSPPWPYYRLEATVQADAKDSPTEIGIFVALKRYDSALGPYSAFWRLRFGEQGPNAGEVDLSATRCRHTPPASYDGRPLGGETPTFTHAPWGKSVLRTLAVEVAPKEIRAYWNGRCIRNVPMSYVERHGQLILSNIKGADGSFTPNGALGVYVLNGTAVFSHVVLSQLSERAK